jgi:predicted CXXCH cytochrome family protein
MEAVMKAVTIPLVLIILLMSAIQVSAGVAETKHNFTSATYSPNAFFYGTRQLCVFCHTPHNGDQSVGALWNHENTPTAYLPYDSPTMDMTVSPPHNGSLVCLTCHDGTIAVNSLNNLPGPETTGNYGTPGGSGLDGSGKLTSSSHAYVGQDLRDDHPVGVTYDASKDASGFHAKTGDNQQYPDKLLDDGLYVECNSCHDPHNNINSNFLIESNDNSQLCFRCHSK